MDPLGSDERSRFASFLADRFGKLRVETLPNFEESGGGTVSVVEVEDTEVAASGSCSLLHGLDQHNRIPPFFTHFKVANGDA